MSDDRDLPELSQQLSRRGLLVTASAAVVCAPVVVRPGSLMPLRGIVFDKTAARLAKFTVEEQWAIRVAAENEGMDGALRHARFILGQVRCIYGELWGRTPAEQEAILWVAKDGPITSDVLREAGIKDRH